MDFVLADGDRASFEDAFRAPFLWSRADGDEALRGWRVLDDARDALHLMHGTGAVALLRRKGDTVLSVSFVEGAAAEVLVRRWGFPAPDDLRRRVRAAFRAGRAVDEAIREAFRHPVTELPARGGLRWIRTPEGAIVEVSAPEGRVAHARLRTGGEALDLLREAAAAARWAVPRVEGPALAARTLAEVRLFVAVQRGTWVEARAEGHALSVLAHLPEGRRVLSFTVADPADGPDTAFGPGTSAILDPAELLLFGERVAREAAVGVWGPGKTRAALQLAAAALREAARFNGPDGQPTAATFQTPAARQLFATQGPRFQAPALLARADALDAAAAAIEVPERTAR
jgi:hypothetical protein